MPLRTKYPEAESQKPVNRDTNKEKSKKLLVNAKLQFHANTIH